MNQAIPDNWESLGAKSIPLTRGYVAIVDAHRYEEISKHIWRVSASHGTAYAVRWAPRVKGQKRRLIFMHREVAGDPQLFAVDHIKSDMTLDNRECNLRLASRSQNRLNSRKTERPKTSQYKGVCWHKKRNKWRVTVGYTGGRKDIGFFDTEVDAAKTYDDAARAWYGQFACVNFADAC